MRKNKLLKYFSLNVEDKYVIEYNSALGYKPLQMGTWTQENVSSCFIEDGLLKVYTTRSVYRYFLPKSRDLSKNMLFDLYFRQINSGQCQIYKFIFLNDNEEEVCVFDQQVDAIYVYLKGEQVAKITYNYDSRLIYGRARIEKIGNTINFYSMNNSYGFVEPILRYSLNVTEEVSKLKLGVSLLAQGCFMISKMEYTEW